ncbi:MAG: hypothetical protein WCW14_03270, partial [Candidatus Paceibacterota bacterium]
MQKDKAFFDNAKKVTDQITNASLVYGKTLDTMKVTPDSVSEFFYEARKINLAWLLGAAHMVNAAEEMLSNTVVEEGFPAEQVVDIIPQVVTPLIYQQQDVLRLKKLIGDKTLVEVKKDEKILQQMQVHVAEYF